MEINVLYIDSEEDCAFSLYMSYMAMPQHKNPCLRGQEI